MAGPAGEICSRAVHPYSCIDHVAEGCGEGKWLWMEITCSTSSFDYIQVSMTSSFVILCFVMLCGLCVVCVVLYRIRVYIYRYGIYTA